MFCIISHRSLDIKRSQRHRVKNRYKVWTITHFEIGKSHKENRDKFSPTSTNVTKGTVLTGCIASARLSAGICGHNGQFHSVCFFTVWVATPNIHHGAVVICVDSCCWYFKPTENRRRDIILIIIRRKIVCQSLSDILDRYVSCEMVICPCYTLIHDVRVDFVIL